MLQQTQVATVLPYFERFLRRFPDVRALARAKESDVLKLWAGLGYYSRARNLHQAAKTIVAEQGGELPRSFERILELPGIGRYTAGAILSIAFGEPYPVLDGNVMRVFARLFALRADVKSAAMQRRMWTLAEQLLNRARPGDWNQALMELGALICTPEAPDCGRCPLENLCAARRMGLETRLPRTAAAKKPVDLIWTCIWSEKDGKILLHRRPAGERFLPGHWGFPELRHLPSAKTGALIRKAKHTITHHRIAIELRRLEPPRRCPPGFRWVDRSRLGDYLVSSAFRKLAA